MTDTRDNNRARMPADVDAPDKILYGLTFRQLAILAVAAVILWAGWRALHQAVPIPVLLGAGGILAAMAAGLVVGRRDGLPLDVWLRHAARHSRAPKALSTVDAAASHPDWVQAPKPRVALPAPLKLPATAIDDDGQITLAGGRAAIVAATTVNLGLRTADEQAALIDTYGRWLNSMSSPTQIVVSAQPVDLASHARTLAGQAPRLPHPALEAACADHAAFLEDLAHRRDPLQRQVLIVTHSSAAERGEHAARRKADDTARALSGLGVTVRALDGAAATAAIAAAADPYNPPSPGGRATPTTIITSPPGGSRKPRRTR
jgi:PrgI family protein